MKIKILFFLFVFVASNLSAEPHTYHKVTKLKETIEGEKLYSQGRYDDAIDKFKEALQKGENRGEPHYYIGSIYESRHQYAESIPHFQEAVRHELPQEFIEATLWKLIILLRKQESYAEMLGYIDLLEDRGTKHENLKKFREEAQDHLSPEKIRARELIKEAKKSTSDWESANENRDFWSTAGIDDQRNKVLEKYVEAVSLDDNLFSLYWEIAGFYEKMSDYQKAAQIYEKIISRNQDAQAYYKVGVIARKTGDFKKARDYLLDALKNLKETSNIKYYLLVNLSQVLYALGEFDDGIRYSVEAKESKTDTDILLDNIVLCLHLSGKKEVRELRKQCDFTVEKNELQKKDIRFISLYHYMLGEVHHALWEKSSPAGDGKIKNPALENYVKALIPPRLRGVSLKGLVVSDSAENYEESKWAILPLWCVVRVQSAINYFSEIHADKEMYLTLLIYKKYLIDQKSDVYLENLASAAYKLFLFDQSAAAYKQIKDRNFSQETGLLKTILSGFSWDEFQGEVINYLQSHPDSSDSLKRYLISDAMVSKMPASKFNSEMKKLMGLVDEEENNPENEKVPEANTESNSSVK